MQIDGRRSNRRGGSTGGGPIEGANRRIRGPIGGANRRSGSQRPCSKQEPRIGGVEGAAMAGWRRRAAGFQVLLPPTSSLPLSTLFPSQSLDFVCCWDGARPRGRYMRSISPALASRHPFFRARSRFCGRAASASTNRTPRQRLGRVRRRHSHPIRGERDASVGKPPGRLGDD